MTNLNPQNAVPSPAGADGRSAESADARLRAAAPELARALSDLLEHYVDLLDSSWHGGHSREEDETVQRARAALAQAGWTSRSHRE